MIFYKNFIKALIFVALQYFIFLAKPLESFAVSNSILSSNNTNYNKNNKNTNFCYSIKEVSINGLQRTSRRNIDEKISKLSLQNTIKQDDINILVKDLYRTNNFEYLDAILTENCYLIINVEEKPMISKITFAGNKKINSENLSTEMLTKEKQPLTMNNLFFDFQRLKAVYSKNGFLDSSFNIYKKNNKKDSTKTEVYIKITEGRSGKIAKIIFNGNDNFTKKQLVEILPVREYSIFKFLSSKSRFDEQTISLADEAIRKFYYEYGYIDYKTKNITSVLDEDRLKFNVYINLTEGDRYKINDVQIIGSNEETKEIANNKDVLKIIKDLKKLKYYQESEVIALKSLIENKLASLGYTLAIVEKSFRRDPMFNDNQKNKNKMKNVDVVFTIKNADKIYINQIRIVGNGKTNDNVIRREILLSEGDLYNADLVRASTQSIRYLGYIKNVEVNEIPANDSKNFVDLEFKIEEGSTGSINFSAGYSSLDKAIAMIGYNQQNIFGRGYDGSFNFEKSRFRNTLAFSMTNPRIFNTFLLGGISFVSMKTDSYQIQDFRQETNSGAFNIGYNLSQKLRHIWGYTYRDDRIIRSNISSISPTIQENFGVFQTSIISHSLVYDKRNNQMIPTKGFLIRFNQSYAGAGGNISYLSNELLASNHISFYKENFVFSVLFKAGRIRGMNGKDVNIKDRFFFGMTEMRGFEFNGIGPRGGLLDGNGKIYGYEQIGLRGNNYEYLSFEQTFPNFIPPDLGFRTYLFYDIGRVYGIDTIIDSSTGYAIVDSRLFRQSYGVGLSWQSPMGLIGFDYGVARKYESFDQKRSFRLNIGAQRYML